MLVVSENLAGLVKQFSICPPELTGEFSLDVRMGGKIRKQKRKTDSKIVLGTRFDPALFFEDEEVIDREVVLSPGMSLLGCSADRYHMPASHFGLLQTKGSVARVFVSITCNDGQIEPGYDGHITLEITNSAAFSVVIPVKEKIGQLYLFRCASPATNPYQGRYQGAESPTVADFS